MQIARFLLRELLENILVFLAATILIFLIIKMAPGDPITLEYGRSMTPEEIEEIAATRGLRDPLTSQYFRWLGRTLRFDLGTFSGFPIRDLIFYGIKITLLLTLGAIVVSMVVGVGLGVAGAVRPHSWFFKTVGFLFFCISLVPIFLLCYGAHIIFLEAFSVLPTLEGLEGRSAPMHVLAFFSMVAILGIGDGTVTEVVRHVRSELGRILSSDFVRALRANGGHLWRHLGKSLLIPVTTILHLRLLYFLGGAVIVESVFQLQGLGWLTWQSVAHQNYGMLFAVSVVSVIAVVILNLINTAIGVVVDPRGRS